MEVASNKMNKMKTYDFICNICDSSIKWLMYGLVAGVILILTGAI